MVKIILVTFGESKKILKITEEDGIDSLRKEFFHKFEVSNCEEQVIFQRYDSVFEEYVDIDEGADKLMAIITSSESVS